MQTGLLALDDAGVASEETCLLQGGAIGVAVDLVQSAGDAEAQRARLPGNAAAVDAGDDVETTLKVENSERSPYQLLVQLVGEVVLQAAAVQRPLAGARDETDAGDGLLAAAQAGAGSGDGLAAALGGAGGLGV